MREPSAHRRRLIAWAPRLLFFLGTGVVTAGLIRQFLGAPQPVHLAGGALLACYLGWLLLEAPVTFRGAVAELTDMATLLAYALARLGILVAVTTTPVRRGWSDWLLVPLALFAVGVALRSTAIRTLGRWYSHHVARGSGQVTVTGGPYRVVRHPAYAGMLLAHAGLVAFFLTPQSALLLGALAAAVIWRLLLEERVLWDMPGYVAYASGRRRLIPGVW